MSYTSFGARLNVRYPISFEHKQLHPPKQEEAYKTLQYNFIPNSIDSSAVGTLSFHNDNDLVSLQLPSEQHLNISVVDHTKQYVQFKGTKSKYCDTILSFNQTSETFRVSEAGWSVVGLKQERRDETPSAVDIGAKALPKKRKPRNKDLKDVSRKK